MDPATEPAVERDPRPEGIYAHYETYPPSGPHVCEHNILVIEKVYGDDTVVRLFLTDDEGEKLRAYLSWQLKKVEPLI